MGWDFITSIAEVGCLTCNPANCNSTTGPTPIVKIQLVKVNSSIYRLYTCFGNVLIIEGDKTQIGCCVGWLSEVKTPVSKFISGVVPVAAEYEKMCPFNCGSTKVTLSGNFAYSCWGVLPTDFYVFLGITDPSGKLHVAFSHIYIDAKILWPWKKYREIFEKRTHL